MFNLLTDGVSKHERYMSCAYPRARISEKFHATLAYEKKKNEIESPALITQIAKAQPVRTLSKICVLLPEAKFQHLSLCDVGLTNTKIETLFFVYLTKNLREKIRRKKIFMINSLFSLRTGKVLVVWRLIRLCEN